MQALTRTTSGRKAARKRQRMRSVFSYTFVQLSHARDHNVHVSRGDTVEMRKGWELTVSPAAAILSFACCRAQPSILCARSKWGQSVSYRSRTAIRETKVASQEGRLPLSAEPHNARGVGLVVDQDRAEEHRAAKAVVVDVLPVLFGTLLACERGEKSRERDQPSSRIRLAEKGEEEDEPGAGGCAMQAQVHREQKRSATRVRSTDRQYSRSVWEPRSGRTCSPKSLPVGSL